MGRRPLRGAGRPLHPAETSQRSSSPGKPEDQMGARVNQWGQTRLIFVSPFPTHAASSISFTFGQLRSPLRASDSAKVSGTHDNNAGAKLSRERIRAYQSATRGYLCQKDRRGQTPLIFTIRQKSIDSDPFDSPFRPCHRHGGHPCR